LIRLANRLYLSHSLG